MKKLLFLILLIPVLSWADCPTQMPEWKDNKGELLIFTEEQNEYYSKLHCEHHRCAAINNLTPTCICENLGGVVREPNNLFRCAYNKSSMDFNKYFYSGYWAVRNREHLQEKNQALAPTNTTLAPPATPDPTPKVSIDDAKIQCEDIGFKAGTERFGECVLELNK